MLRPKVDIEDKVRQIRKRGRQHGARYVGIADDRQDIPGGSAAMPDEGRTWSMNLSAHVIVDQEINYTIVGGRFSPTSCVDLNSQIVILSVSGPNNFSLTISASSFIKTGLGGYIARVVSDSIKTDLLLQPFSRGDWAYSASIEGFVPRSTPVSVSLTIGSQAGKATAKVFGFCVTK